MKPRKIETQQVDFAGPKQLAGFEYGPYPLCLSGAYNSAKTVTLCLKMLYVADMFPGYRWFVGRKIWDELKKTTMASFFKFCRREAWEPGGRRSDVDKTLVLNNGSSFLWGHLDDPDTLTLIRGLEINGFLLDQAEELYEEIFTAILPRMGRWDQVTVPDAVVQGWNMANPGWKWPWTHEVTGRLMPPSYALLTCNPDHELHWIYRRFHPDSPDHEERSMLVEHRPTCVRANCRCGRMLANGRMARPGERVSYKDLGYRMIELSAYDNKYATRQSLEEMESQDETWKRRFLFGKWGIPEGQIHHVRDESILEPTPEVLSHIEHFCTLHRSMDHGDTAPTAVLWWAVDRDGNIFCFREYYKPNALISDHRNAVWGLSRDERYRLNLADPAIFAPSMQKHGMRWSVAQEWDDRQHFAPETAVSWERGDNDELGTRNKISEYLRPCGTWERRGGESTEVDRVHPITKEKGRWPRLFFVKKTQDYPNGCSQIIRELKSQRREKIGSENGRALFSDDRDPRIPDHSYDCVSGKTRVVTPSGDIPISELRESGMVLTPEGWTFYHDCRKYREDSDMVRVGFEDGRALECTPDHMVLTDEGWIRADQLMGMMVLDTLAYCGVFRVSAVTPIAQADSYCLTVNSPSHAFCVEGGIVIHNCLRYFVAAQAPLPYSSPKRAGKGTLGWWKQRIEQEETRRGVQPRGDYVKRYG